MLDSRFIYYIDALNLSPLWLKKNIIISSNNSATEIAQNKIVALSNTIKASEKNHLSTSAKQAKLPTNETGTSVPTVTPLKPNNNQVNSSHPLPNLIDLQITSRLLYTQATINNKNLLILLLSSQLDNRNPQQCYLKSRYYPLLSELFKQSQIKVINFNSLQQNSRSPTELIEQFNGAAILLLSHQFNKSLLIKNALSKKNVPIIQLEHPNTLIRSPYLKKHSWHLLRQLLTL